MTGNHQQIGVTSGCVGQGQDSIAFRVTYATFCGSSVKKNRDQALARSPVLGACAGPTLYKEQNKELGTKDPQQRLQDDTI